jgi:hypothetical protein
MYQEPIGTEVTQPRLGREADFGMRSGALGMQAFYFAEEKYSVRSRRLYSRSRACAGISGRGRC